MDDTHSTSSPRQSSGQAGHAQADDLSVGSNQNQSQTNPVQSSASQKNEDFQVDDQLKKLEDAINAASLPADLQDKTIAMLNRLKLIKNDSGFFMEYDSISRYINWVASLPWNKASSDILDLTHAKQILDKNHYGLGEVKEKILEYLSIMIIKNSRRSAGENTPSRAPIISLVGLVGIGKTTVAFSIAEALGRRIQRIPFGGMGAASQLRGKTRLFPDAEPGLIIKSLSRVGVNNPVILLDEIDRVSQEARSDIMGILIEILDPEQNENFTDHFIDYPFNLSNVLFIATSNNTKDVSTAVLDRLEIIQMPSYTDQEKITIAKDYMFPKILKQSGMTNEEIVIDDNLWGEIIRPLGYDSGIRSLEQTIEGLVRKIAYFQLLGKIPMNQQFRVTTQNFREFVPQW